MNIRLIFGALLGAALLSGMALVGPLAREVRGDFILWDDQQMTVNTVHAQGSLYETSRAFIVSGGQVGGRLRIYDSSAANISGGSVNYLDAYNASTVNISDGSVNNLTVYETSTVNVSISGGSVEYYMHVYDGGTVDISGGLLNHLYAGGTSVITFHGRDFRTHGGLWLDGNRVLGTTGALTGEWFDGTSWAVNIPSNEATVTIMVIPEPATLSLLALGSVVLLRRRGRA